MKKIRTLYKTEMILAWRSPDSVIFGMIMPVVVMGLTVLIYKDHPYSRGLLEETMGAYLSIGICAFGLMSLPLVLSDYRSRKVLKRFQVTPVSPGLLLTVQVLVQGSMALISAGITALAAALFFSWTFQGNPAAFLTAFLLVAGCIFSIGLVIASTAKDFKKAGVLCSIVYFPMLLLSGAMIPYSVFPLWLQTGASWLPLRQGIIILNRIAAGQQGKQALFSPETGVLLLIILLCTGLSLKTFRWDLPGS
ncbi:MAG: ABC transporter permease [Spirochaetales bacterium]|nr:ABC transporter permease [Spirochaetales bacterium]